MYHLIAGNSHPELAREVASYLKKKLTPVELYRFSCGEIYARILETVRNEEVYILQTATSEVNEDYMELFVLIDAVKRSIAKKITVVIPHFGYARQDREALPRETISAKLMADLIVKAGANHVILMHMHSDQEQGFFDVTTDNLSTKRLFVEYFQKKHLDLNKVVVVSPDSGGAKMATRFANALGTKLAIIHKVRPASNRKSQSSVSHVVGNVKGKITILYDDLIDTAGSVCKAKEALLRHGADPKNMYLVASHPVFSGPAIRKLKKANFREVVVTNTIPVPSEKNFPGLKVLSVAPLLANVIRNITSHKSVSSLHN